MNQGAKISWDSLHALFSVVMCIDKSLNIAYASPTLQKFVPLTGGNASLHDVFKVLRPSSLDSFAEAIAAENSLCLMTAKNGEFAMRGQLVATRYNDTDVLCFCGSPWLFWLNSNCPDLHLNLADFSTQDVQLDQLFFMSTEKRMVEDLEKLAADLQATKVALEKAQLAQSEFFAHMSHELRTPLNGVVSAISLMDESAMDEKQRELVAFARSSSENLMQVINYVLDVSKLEHSEINENETFNLPEFLLSTCNVVRAKANQKSLGLELDILDDIPRSYEGLKSPLRHALLNLLINAIKFTEQGTIKLRARLIDRAGDNCRVRFEICDNGCGIAEKDQERVFEPFVTLQTNKSRGNENSTGLGLDIVRRSVQKMQGELGLFSNQVKGTTFWFEIPLKIVKDDPTRLLPIDLNQQLYREETLSGTVLLVDDNETNLLLGSMILESLSLEVRKVTNGADAVEAARTGPPDLILMDISMPGISGLEATRLIRTFADRDSLPILALTAHVDSRERQSCLDIGMNGYLTKPIVREALYAALAKWLGVAEGASDDLLDETVLDQLVGQIGEDNLSTVIEKVQDEAAQRWGELTQSISSGDTTATQRHVHSLGSIFRSVGLTPAGDAFSAIESRMRTGDRLETDWLSKIEPIKTESLIALNRRRATR